MPTDSVTREARLKTYGLSDEFEYTYTIRKRDGDVVKEILFYDYDKEQIYMLFYNDESYWGLMNRYRWQAISRI